MPPRAATWPARVDRGRRDSHTRRATNADSIVVSVRHSYREGGKIRKWHRHVACCPLDPWPAQVGLFWRRWDAVCVELEVPAATKRAWEKRIRAAGVPRRPPATGPGGLAKLEAAERKLGVR